MKKLVICVAVLFVTVLLGAQQQKEEFQKQLDPQPAHLEKIRSQSGCKVDLSQEEGWYVDFRSCDLSKENLNELDQKTVNSYLSFDDKTIWPKGDKMPKWLNPKEIMAIGKTPGLNIKQLHAQGITGKGVGIAIIDGALPKHAEYQERLVSYKDYGANHVDLMHGAAVASIAVGKTVGVAPGANLYYFAAEDWIAAIYKILEMNKTLPADKKIAVISMSYGFPGKEDKLNAAIKEAEKQNISIFYTESSSFILDRSGFYEDPNDLSSYTKPVDWRTLDRAAPLYLHDICVPAGFRILASPTGYNDYVAYGGSGSMSWAVPYYAGVCALAKQVYPALTAEEFEEAARVTAHSKKIKYDETGEEAEVKYFINPAGIIEYLQKKSAPNERKAASEGDADIMRQNLKEAINKAVEGKKADKQPARKK